jgi:hypothetical protein
VNVCSRRCDSGTGTFRDEIGLGKRKREPNEDPCSNRIELHLTSSRVQDITKATTTHRIAF